MVELVDDFEKLKEHASYCRIIGYKIEAAGKNIDNPPKSLFRIRIRAGSYAWDKIVDEDTTKGILEWLKQEDAIKIVGAVCDEMFFA